MLTAIRQWVLRTMMKDQTGVMRTLPKRDLVDFNVAMTAERLMRNGFDPNAFKNANQVENAINQIEAPRNVQQGIKSTQTAKVFNVAGEELDPSKPIIGGTQPGKKINTDAFIRNAQAQETEAQIAKRLGEENKQAAQRIRNRKMVKDAVDNASPGFVKGDRKYNAQLVADDLAEKKFGKDFYDLDQKQQMDLYDEALDGLDDSDKFAQGGRAGFKEGSMTRRTFLKILGGLASIPIVGKILKPVKIGKTVSKVPVIKTAPVEGKPEWFDSLVNKVIAEGDDVTKRFATGERQSIHQKTLDDGSVVRVTEDTDQGAVRVEYESSENVFGDPVQMEYKRPLPDEATPDPAAEFTTAESGPVGRAYGPDDFEIEIEEVGGRSIKDLDSDVSKLKEYATGKKPTMKELVQNIDRRKKAKRITEDPEAQSDAVIARQGEAGDYQDYASGGIARMLGE